MIQCSVIFSWQEYTVKKRCPKIQGGLFYQKNNNQQRSIFY